jgi:hypothetical protein
VSRHPGRALLTGAFAALLPLSACAPDDDVRDEQDPLVGSVATEPEEAPIPDPGIAATDAEESMEGRLTRVDPVEQVFFLTDADGVEWEFRYLEATNVMDDGAPQGLADTEGSRVRVYYDGDPDARTAIRISVLPEAGAGDSPPTLP